MRIGIFSLWLGLCWGAIALGEVPTIRTIQPIGIERGQTIEVEMTGDELGSAHQIMFYSDGLKATQVKPTDNKKLKVTIVASEDAACDLHAFRVVTENGISNLRLFGVSPFPGVNEVEPNNERDKPQLIELNRTIQGSIQPEDTDFFVIEAPSGQMISLEIEGLRHNYLNNMFDPFVAIYDDQGVKLASSDDAALVQQDCVCGVVTPAAGRYLIEVRDSSYGGSRDSFYRLHVGSYARPLAVYPSGGKPGELLKATCVDGLGNSWEENFQLPANADERFGVWSMRGDVMSPSPNFVRVNDLNNVLESEPNEDYKDLKSIGELPAALNGCLAKAGERDWFVFDAKKGQTFDFRLIGRQIIRSPIDAVIEVVKVGGSRIASGDDSPSPNGLAGPDALVAVKIPEDGQYAVSVKDHLNRGGLDYVYRLEATATAPKLTTTIKEQERYLSQTIPIPRGARMAVNVLLDRKAISGASHIVVPNLPEGIEQVACTVSEQATAAQLILQAKSDAPLGGSLLSLNAKLKLPDGKELLGHMDQRTQLVRGQNNRDVWGINSDKLAVAVVDAVPFDIEIIPPKVPLVRDGSLPLTVKLHRKDGFKRSVRIKLLETSPGVTASTSVTIADEKDTAEIPLTANSKAAIGKWPVTVLASTKVGENSSVVIASKFVDVEVAEKLFEFEFNKTMAELGKPAKITVGVNLNRELPGKVEVELVGLPPGTTMEKPRLPIAKDSQRISYTLSVPANARPGIYKTIACRGTVTSDLGVITQVNGMGEVQIDPARKTSKESKANADDKPLSRLEELRKQREEEKP
jgi:hypothetical protein